MSPGIRVAPLATGALTAGILLLARWKTPFTILLADRFYPGLGWVEILVLALYAAILVTRFLKRRDTSGIRLSIWLLFSIVFFNQFILQPQYCCHS